VILDASCHFGEQPKGSSLSLVVRWADLESYPF
jgi:hypothetical protein